MAAPDLITVERELLADLVLQLSHALKRLGQRCGEHPGLVDKTILQAGTIAMIRASAKLRMSDADREYHGKH